MQCKRTAFTRLVASLFCFMTLACIHSHAQAQSLDLIFNPPDKTGRRGQTLTFNATLTNQGATTFTWEAGGPSFSMNLESGFTADAGKLTQNFNSSLGPGQSITADMFDVTIGSNVADGAYFGTMILQKGDTIVANQNFLITVTPAPPALLVMLIGGLGTAVAARKRARSTPIPKDNPAD